MRDIRTVVVVMAIVLMITSATSLIGLMVLANRIDWLEKTVEKMTNNMTGVVQVIQAMKDRPK